jgi:uncharacterized membrane protein
MSEQHGTTNVLETRRQYQKRMNHSAGVGFVLGVVLLTVGAFVGDAVTVLGVGVYWAGMFGYLYFRHRAPVDVRDEREQRISREASELTLEILAVAVILATPTATVFDSTGVYDVPEFVWGGVTTLVLTSVVIGFAHWYVERQRS